MKILFLTNIPSPYRVSFFEELGKNCELTVLFEKGKSDERDLSWGNYSFKNFKGIFLKGISISTDTAFCFNVVSYLKDNYFDCIIITNISSPTSMLAIEYLKFMKIPYCFETDGGVVKITKNIKEIIKKHFLSGAIGYFSPCISGDEYLIKYGAKQKNIFRYPFTSLYKKDILNIPISNEYKQIIRKQLYLNEEKIIISVGRFSYQQGYGKGYDTLLTIAEKLSDEIGVYIIGDEPTNEFIQWKENKKLYNVHFLPFMNKELLFKYYQAADLSILLTRGDVWGLVINESMANACPVITTTACVAGNELITNGRNGYLVPVNSPDITLKKILKLLNEKELCDSFSIECLKTIRNYTFEKMAEYHITAIRKINNETMD